MWGLGVHILEVVLRSDVRALARLGGQSVQECCHVPALDVIHAAEHITAVHQPAGGDLVVGQPLDIHRMRCGIHVHVGEPN